MGDGERGVAADPDQGAYLLDDISTTGAATGAFDIGFGGALSIAEDDLARGGENDILPCQRAPRIIHLDLAGGHVHG